jgi:hypothetical protein
VAGVQNGVRQHSSLVPFFQTLPSTARQLSTGLPCAKAPDKGAASAADANSNATLFSFFIDSPLKESRRNTAERPNRKRENLANTRFGERSPPTTHCAIWLSAKPYFGRSPPPAQAPCCASATAGEP